MINWLKTNYRGRAIVACLIGLMILWSKATMVLDIINVVVYKEYEVLRKYGVEVTYAEESGYGITIEDEDTIVIDNVEVYDDNIVVGRLDSLLIPSPLVIEIKMRRGKQ